MLGSVHAQFGNVPNDLARLYVHLHFMTVSVSFSQHWKASFHAQLRSCTILGAINSNNMWTNFKNSIFQKENLPLQMCITTSTKDSFLASSSRLHNKEPLCRVTHHSVCKIEKLAQRHHEGWRHSLTFKYTSEGWCKRFTMLAEKRFDQLAKSTSSHDNGH